MGTISDLYGTDTQFFFFFNIYLAKSGSEILFLTTVAEPQFPVANHFPPPKRFLVGKTNSFPVTYRELQLNISVLSKYASLSLRRVMSP